ncbi:hypothetical protein ACJX0J_017705, partial [Zea mays]
GIQKPIRGIQKPIRQMEALLVLHFFGFHTFKKIPIVMFWDLTFWLIPVTAIELAKSSHANSV